MVDIVPSTGDVTVASPLRLYPPECSQPLPESHCFLPRKIARHGRAALGDPRTLGLLHGFAFPPSSVAAVKATALTASGMGM